MPMVSTRVGLRILTGARRDAPAHTEHQVPKK
jgi:hypothetical protein